MKRHASMNRVYRMVWNEQAGTMVAVAENVRGRGKRAARGLLMAGLLAGVWCNAAHAAPPANQLPTGAQVTSGIASVTQSGNVMTVKQGSDKLIANWNSFNIGQDAKVQFVQPGSSSVALNRIADASPSQIFGQLSANGQVFLLNPSGIIFGASARVDVGALVASTLNLSSANFLTGNYQFVRTGNAGSISNQGSINASGGGASVVALIAPQVSNSGSIAATGGNVALAAGDKVSLDFSGNGLIKVQVDQGTLNALSENKGLIQADGGAVLMTARAASDVMDAVVNNEGTIQARTLQNKGGRIMLLSDMTHGETRVGGTLDASAPHGGDGGFIETSAAHVKVLNSARITTQAPSGKSGKWLVDPTDFTISAAGGDMTGAFLATQLQTTDIGILSSGGAAGTNGDIFVNDNVFVTGGTAAHTLTLQAWRDIVFGNGMGLDASANGFGINTVLWSNFSGTGGYVSLGIGSTILTKGGHLWIGGGSGSTLWNGLTVGNGYAQGLSTGNPAGIYISNGVINTNGGHIAMYGKSVALSGVSTNPDGQSNSNGIVSSFNEQYAINSGTGTVYLNGLGVDANTLNFNGDAVYLNGGTLTSAAATGDAITIVGDASASRAKNNASGIALVAWDSVKSNAITATGGGNIVMTGSGGVSAGPGQAYSMGVRLDQATTGTNTVSTSAVGNITVSGTAQIATSSAVGASINTSMSAGGSLLVNAMGGAGINSLANFTASGSSGLIAGTGDLLLGGSVTSSGTTPANTLTLKAERDVVMAATSHINTAGAGSPISVMLQSNATDLAAGGAIVMLPGSAIYSKGGNITLSGGSIPLTSTYAVGRDGLGALGGVAGVGGGADAGNGIALIGATLSSAGGNIVLRGKSFNGGNVVNSAGHATADGIFINESGGTGSLIDSGTGTIKMVGLSLGTITATDFGYAVSVSLNSKVKSGSAPATTSIDINGDASLVTASTGAIGVAIDGTIEAVAGGNVNIVGNGKVGSIEPWGWGIHMDLTGKVLASGGAISMVGVGPTYGIGANNSTSIGIIAADAPAIASSVSLTSTSGMVLGGPISSAGQLYLASSTGTDMQGVVTSTTGTVTLQTGTGPGMLSYGGSISAPSLLLNGAAFQLMGQPFSGGAPIDGSASANSVGTLAANVTGGGGLSFMNSGNLSVGTVGATNGITMSGSGFVAIATSGDLNVAQNISSAYNGVLNGGTAVVLVAGNGAAAGNAAAGNITVTGSPVISVGAGGNAGLFSSGIASSTGLAPLINAGNFRYNSSFQLGLASLASPSYTFTPGFTPTALGAGLFAVYREQPAVSLAVNSPAITYGQTPSLGVTVTAGALQNGDAAGVPLLLSPINSTAGFLAAGTYSVVAPAVLSNLGYAVTSAPGSLTVNPASITAVTGITAVNRAYDGSLAATINVGAAGFTGMLAGDVLSLGGGATGVFVDKNVGNAKTVNISGLALTGADASNYTLASSTATASANITAASLTISGATAQNKVYDGTTAATISGAVLAGTVYPGDVVSLASAGSGLFVDKNVGTGKAVSTAATLGGADAGNYTLTQPTGLSANITPATISAITGVTAASRVYNGTTTATLSTATAGFTGMVAGDALAVVGGSGAFLDKNVGTAKTVNVGGLSLGGVDAANYTLASNTATTSANITAASISAVTGITASNRVYDGTTAATLNTAAAGFSGKVAGDVLALAAGSVGAFADKNVGTGKTVNISGLGLTGLDAGNYALASNTATTSANITAASLTISGATAQNKVYDSTTAATISGATLAGTVYAGDVVSLANAGSGTFTDKNVGTGKAVSTAASLSGASAANYALTQPTGLSANITAASLSISGAVAVSRAYDGTTNATINGATLAGTVYAGDAVSLANASSGLFADKNVGTAKAVSTAATLSGASAANYALTQPTGLSANITAASLTISGATAQNKVYDGTTAVTINGATLAGTVYAGDVVSLANASNGTFTDKNVGTAKAVSTAASLSGASAANYTLTQPTGLSANITTASLTISGATAQNKVYDGTTAATISGATLAGTVYAGDAVSLANAGSGSFADPNVGTAKAVSMAASLSGTGASNYALIQPTGLTASITNAAPSAGSVVTQLAPATQNPVSITTSTALVSSSAQQVGLISFGVGITPPTPAAPNTTTETAPAAGSTSGVASGATPASIASSPTTSADTSDSKSNTGSVPSGSASGSGSATTVQDKTTGVNSTASTPAATPPATASAPTASGSQSKVASTTAPVSGKAAAKGTSKSATAASASAPAKAAVAKAAPTRAGNSAVRPLPGNLNAALAGKALNGATAPGGLRSNVPEAIKNFAAAVPDVVGQNNPMLAESRIVPRELEQDIRASRQDEMVQSYDSIPSAMSGTRSKKSGQSKTVNLFEETLEVVNFLNLMTLKIIP